MGCSKRSWSDGSTGATIRRATIVVVLCGGVKASQQRDIRRAQQMAVQLEEGR